MKKSSRRPNRRAASGTIDEVRGVSTEQFLTRSAK